jgi:hypothetical protein
MQTLSELNEVANGLYRIGVSKADLLSWHDFKGKVPAALAKHHESYGRRMGGNPEEWYASLEPVCSDRWLAIEQWDAVTQSWGRFPSCCEPAAAPPA